MSFVLRRLLHLHRYVNRTNGKCFPVVGLPNRVAESFKLLTTRIANLQLNEDSGTFSYERSVVH